MDDNLKEPNLNNTPNQQKKSKYTDEQKAAIIEASRLSKKLLEIMKRVSARHEIK